MLMYKDKSYLPSFLLYISLFSLTSRYLCPLPWCLTKKNNWKNVYHLFKPIFTKMPGKGREKNVFFMAVCQLLSFLPETVVSVDD